MGYACIFVSCLLLFYSGLVCLLKDETESPLFPYLINFFITFTMGVFIFLSTCGETIGAHLFSYSYYLDEMEGSGTIINRMLLYKITHLTGSDLALIVLNFVISFSSPGIFMFTMIRRKIKMSGKHSSVENKVENE